MVKKFNQGGSFKATTITEETPGKENKIYMLTLFLNIVTVVLTICAKIGKIITKLA